MYKYIEILLKAAWPVNHMKRKEYLRSFYGSCQAHRFGMVDKFVKAVGYNDIFEDMVSQYPVILPAKVQSPDDYTTPEQLLKQGLHIDLNPFNVVKFVVPLGKEEHPDKRFSYSHKTLCKKFAEFLAKVYPELTVEMKLLKDYDVSLQDFALDYFYQCMDVDGTPYTAEFSSHRLLESQEIYTVEKTLKELYKFPFKITQNYCETCAERHADHPYHVEVEYG